MPINQRQFTVNAPSLSDTREIKVVEKIARSLASELTRVSDEIDARHQWRAKSDQIQDIFFEWLARTYRVSIEKTEGFEDTETRGNRPDAQIWLNDPGSRRILLEVERGGTVTNGHDLKDCGKRTCPRLLSTCSWLFRTRSRTNPGSLDPIEPSFAARPG
jgi:hypothetical protein